MILNQLLKFRYLFLVVVIIMLINSVFFIIVGVVECVQGYVEFTRIAFKTTESIRPGEHLLEALDYFVSALVFMIFGLGFAQLFLFDKMSSDLLPKGMRVGSLKQLKVLLWETILVALVIYCITNLLRTDVKSWDLLPFPVLILILSIALFFFKSNGVEKNKSN